MTPDLNRLRTLLALVQLGLRQQILDHLAAHPKAQATDTDRTTGTTTSDPTSTATRPRHPRMDRLVAPRTPHPRPHLDPHGPL